MWLTQYPSLVGPVQTPVEASVDGGGQKSAATMLWQYVGLAGPVLAPSTITDVTSTPLLPTINPTRKRLHASQHAAWFFDTQWEAPAAVTVPDLPPQPIVDVRRRRFRPELFQAAHPAFGIEVPVPVMSWTGWYDWRHPAWAKKRHASQMPAYFQDTVLFPDVVVSPDMTVATYPERVQARRRVVQFPQPFWPPFTADVSAVVPNLSWQPEYPDRIWPEEGLAARFQEAFEMDPRPVPVIAVSHLSGGRGYYVVPGRPRKFTVPPHKRTFTVN